MKNLIQWSGSLEQQHFKNLASIVVVKIFNLNPNAKLPDFFIIAENHKYYC